MGTIDGIYQVGAVQRPDRLDSIRKLRFLRSVVELLCRVVVAIRADHPKAKIDLEPA